ncbi:hypothetical protein YB2330_006125 [Saitoella coloradoensis]
MGKRKRQEIEDHAEIELIKIGGTIVQHTEATFPPSLLKYWHQRYRYFSRFDEGIWMDDDGWFSVTPENIAWQIAEHTKQTYHARVIVDAFCGVGGNTIQFAQTCDKVIAIDNDPARLACAKHNAEIYGVQDKIEFIEGDFLTLAEQGRIEADTVFMSMPWGGISYSEAPVFDICTMEPYNAPDLMQAANKVSRNVILYLPRTSSPEQIASLAKSDEPVEMHYLYTSGKAKALTAYFGGVLFDRS